MHEPRKVLIKLIYLRISYIHLIQSIFLNSCYGKIIFLNAVNIKRENKRKLFPFVDLSILKYEDQIVTSAMGKNKSEKKQ